MVLVQPTMLRPLLFPLLPLPERSQAAVGGWWELLQMDVSFVHLLMQPPFNQISRSRLGSYGLNRMLKMKL